ncbi:hypothetical protein JB92DRAFT_3135097 [Gautieria morchelliformis]|nr:hypothetical protein JB92DRAFT_3135097 [Gautieria morchelliformis]
MPHLRQSDILQPAPSPVAPAHRSHPSTSVARPSDSLARVASAPSVAGSPPTLRRHHGVVYAALCTRVPPAPPRPLSPPPSPTSPLPHRPMTIATHTEALPRVQKWLIQMPTSLLLWSSRASVVLFLRGNVIRTLEGWNACEAAVSGYYGQVSPSVLDANN